MWLGCRKLRFSGFQVYRLVISQAFAKIGFALCHMSCSLNSAKGRYIGDYIGEYYRGYLRGILGV